MEDFSELFKRHVPIGNHRVVYDNWTVGNTVSGKRFLHYRMILLFCLIGSFFHNMNNMRQKYKKITDG